jgi:hypothetical protein
MKKKNLKAQVRELTFDGRDGYVINIYDEQTETWDFDSFFPLVAVEDIQGKVNCISEAFIIELKKLQKWGYDINF